MYLSLQDRSPLLPQPAALSKAAEDQYKELAAKEDCNNDDLLQVGYILKLQQNI